MQIDFYYRIEFIIKQSEHYLNKLKFINYLCNNLLQNINHLENCYNKELTQCA